MKTGAFLVIILALARPLPAHAEIAVKTFEYPPQYGIYNPPASSEDIALLTKAIYRLASDPRLEDHPIRRFLNDPQAKMTIVFNNPLIESMFGDGALTLGDQIHLKSSGTLDYYLQLLAHEFVHIDIIDKYGNNLDFGFLNPEDYAFSQLMEEAFCNSLENWVRVSYPEINTNRQARNWERQNNGYTRVDAMRNDFKATSNLSDEQIAAKVAREMFHQYMCSSNFYTSDIIPQNLKRTYGNQNNFLIPEYAAYRRNADALLRHKWNYLASIMPFELSRGFDYDYYRRVFKECVTDWAQYADSPKKSILYWLNYDYVGAARAKFSGSYDYLSREDEERLNRIMREIDPYFTPVNTSAKNPFIQRDR